MSRFFMFVFFVTTGMLSAQQTDYVDFNSIKADLSFTGNGDVSGFMSIEFEIKSAIDSIYLDAVGMTIQNLSLEDLKKGNPDDIQFENDGKRIIVQKDFKAKDRYLLRFWYAAQPKKALYFVEDQIWTQGQGKYTSNWLPSLDDVNDKIEFDLSITYDKDYEVMANGELIKVEESDASKTWHFNMDQPMSSYLVALAIGNYDKKTETSKSGIPLEFYYYPEDSLKVEPTYRYSKQMFDFLEDEIGVPYPWEIYKQVPVRDFLYSGMENTTLTLFSDTFVVDSIGFHDHNYVNVNAHELAHQWFGNLVTAKSGDHHWLQEGFATYYALLAERAIFGEDYYYWRLYEYAQQLMAQEAAGESTSLLDPKSSSLTFYQKGCWVLHVLKERVGEAAFRTAVWTYLDTHRFGSVETPDFIAAVERAAHTDLGDFVHTWLETVALPWDAMMGSLKKSAFIQEYLATDCEVHPSKCQGYLTADISGKAKAKIVLQDAYAIQKEDFENGWEVRQAIAQKLTEIPSELKADYESLLKDASYITKEIALYNLWANFPEDRVDYLQQTKDVIGLGDRNVRLLWLALNLNTPGYQPAQKQMVYDELKGYTDPKYGFELRMNAFNYLKLINGFDEISIKNLLQSTTHHNWRFQQFSKALLEELKQNERYEAIINRITNNE